MSHGLLCPTCLASHILSCPAVLCLICFVPYVSLILMRFVTQVLLCPTCIVTHVPSHPEWLVSCLLLCLTCFVFFLRALVSHVHQALRLLLPRMPCAVIFPVNHVLCASHALCFMYPHTLWVFFLCTLFNASYLKYSMCQYYSLCLLCLTHLFYYSLPSCDLFGGIYLS